MTAPLRLLGLLLLLALALLALLWGAQRRLLYFPDTYDLERARGAAARLGLEPWAPAGVFLGWRAATPGARGTLLVFHGNAGSALDRAYFAGAFARAHPALPLDVVLVEYPGYGPRPGAPGQPAILAAAHEALREARRANPGPVLLAGESLGGAVASLAAAEAPAEVAGVILVVPLASVPAVAARHYPWLPGWLARDAWRADRALPRYGGPVAFLLARHDEVTFFDLGDALYERHPGRKRRWVDERATHNTIDWRPELPRWREMIELVAPPASR